MICKNCQTKLPEGSSFCFYCGCSLAEAVSTPDSFAPQKDETPRKTKSPFRSTLLLTFAGILFLSSLLLAAFAVCKRGSLPQPKEAEELPANEMRADSYCYIDELYVLDCYTEKADSGRYYFAYYWDEDDRFCVVSLYADDDFALKKDLYDSLEDYDAFDEDVENRDVYVLSGYFRTSDITETEDLSAAFRTYLSSCSTNCTRDFSEKNLIKTLSIGIGAEDHEGKGNVTIEQGWESAYQPVKDVGTPIVEQNIKKQDVTTFEDGVIDCMLEVGFLYKSVSQEEYGKILAWEEETGIPVMYPLVEDNEYHYDAYDANCWYKTNKRGTPVSVDEDGTAHKIELQAGMVLEDNYKRDKNGDPIYWEYAGGGSFETAQIRIRVLYYNYYRYLHGFEPGIYIGESFFRSGRSLRLRYHFGMVDLTNTPLYDFYLGIPITDSSLHLDYLGSSRSDYLNAAAPYGYLYLAAALFALCIILSIFGWKAGQRRKKR